MVGTILALQLVTVAVTATFGAIVLAGGPRRSANLFLAAFLFLICGNQVAEIVRSMAFEAGQTLLKNQAYKVATVFATLDPFFLYYFTSIHPERNRLRRPWRLGLVGGVAALLTLAAVFIPIRGSGGSGALVWELRALLWAIFVAVVYAVIFVHLASHLLENPRGPHGRLLVPALAFVTVPALTRSLVRFRADLPLEAVTGWVPTGQLALAALIVTAVLPLAVWWWSGRGGLARDLGTRRFLTASVVGGTLLALLTYLMLWRAADPLIPLDLSWLDASHWSRSRSIAGTVKWTAFSLLTSVAVLRFDMLGMSLRARRRAARVLVALGVLSATGLGLVVGQAWLSAGGFSVSPFDLVLLGIVVLASQGFRSVTDRVAERVYGVPMPGDRAAAAEAYRAALEQARAEGRPVGEDPELARLREELALDEETAAMLEQAVRPFDAGPIRRDSRVAGRYTVSRLLGEGGSGRAWLAYDEVLDRDVVLKEVPAPGEDERERAMDEARIAGGLQHANVVTVHDVIERTASIVIITEYVAGGSLQDRLDQDGPLPIEEGVPLIEAILVGLQAVHTEGVVHRDLKPSNVLLATDGTAKLADFGIARVRRGVTRTQEAAEIVAGTPEFMAPEQRRGEVATQASDLYAVGKLMEACLDASLPSELEEIQGRAMAEDPEQRWASAEAMGAALSSG